MDVFELAACVGGWLQDIHDEAVSAEVPVDLLVRPVLRATFARRPLRAAPAATSTGMDIWPPPAPPADVLRPSPMMFPSPDSPSSPESPANGRPASVRSSGCPALGLGPPPPPPGGANGPLPEEKELYESVASLLSAAPVTVAGKKDRPMPRSGTERTMVSADGAVVSGRDAHKAPERRSKCCFWSARGMDAIESDARFGFLAKWF